MEILCLLKDQAVGYRSRLTYGTSSLQWLVSAAHVHLCVCFCVWVGVCLGLSLCGNKVMSNLKVRCVCVHCQEKMFCPKVLSPITTRCSNCSMFNIRRLQLRGFRLLGCQRDELYVLLLLLPVILLWLEETTKPHYTKGERGACKLMWNSSCVVSSKSK